MAVHPFVPTGLQQPPCGENPWYYITTEGLTHLRLLLWFSEPAQAWHVTNHRGRRGRPRLRILTPPDLCIDQTEPDQTETHFWVLPPGAPGTTVWITWSETCVLSIKQPSAPPFPITYSSCGGQASYASAGGSITNGFSQLADVPLPVNPFIEGDAACYDAVNNHLRAATTGTWRLSLYYTMVSGSNIATLTGVFSLKNLADGIERVPQNVTLPMDGSPVKVQASFDFTVGLSNSRLVGNWRPTGGVSFGNLLPSCYGYIQKLS